jgi:predicted flap endonuclease-1-like 5' DNA nuclease
MPSIDVIEGIGPTFATKLRKSKVRTTEALLKKGATRGDRKRLALASGLTEQQILEWVNRADLYRIKGVGSEYSDLLERAGVDTVVELANRNAANLSKAIKDLVGKGTRIVRRIPSDREIASWITQAKKLPRAVEY